MPPFKLSHRLPTIRCGVQGSFAAAHSPNQPQTSQFVWLIFFLSCLKRKHGKRQSPAQRLVIFTTNSDLIHIEPIEADFECPARTATIEHDGQYQEVSDGSHFIDAIVR
jgi:hypothetical protein